MIGVGLAALLIGGLGLLCAASSRRILAAEAVGKTVGTTGGRVLRVR
jgi:hypothetical protein